MKHSWTITLALLGLFIVAQFFGLFIIDHYTTTTLPYNLERPDVNADTPFLSTGIIILFILIATLILLTIIKFRLGVLWKIWFGLAVFITLSITLGAFIPTSIALGVALILTLIKFFWKNYIYHDLTEIMIYAAIASLFGPAITPLIAILLLIGISIYDFIAVRKTKHMITLAEYQTKEKLFSGFYIPKKDSMAILGGGDVVFPLIFAGSLFTVYGYKTLLISLGALIGLGVLFYLAKKKTYYPAMPFVTAGCLAGYGILTLL